MAFVLSVTVKESVSKESGSSISSTRVSVSEFTAKSSPRGFTVRVKVSFPPLTLPMVFVMVFFVISAEAEEVLMILPASFVTVMPFW